MGTSNIIEAEVKGPVGDLLQVSSAPDDRMLVVPPPDRALRAGDKLAFTVRPEKLKVAPLNEPVAEKLCTTTGTVADIVYQGVSTQLVVQTDDGSTLVAFRQNNERVSDAGEPGTRTRLVWDPEFNVVLADEPTLDSERAAARQKSEEQKDE
jgi:ABC-type Fe3+/spermidine/putrescine transport system ATPase subunit